MKHNGKRVWQVTTDHSIGIGKENHVENLAMKLQKVLDENHIENNVKYSSYRVEIEVFTFDDMCSVSRTLSTLLDEDKYKLTGIKVETSKY